MSLRVYFTDTPNSFQWFDSVEFRANGWVTFTGDGGAVTTHHTKVRRIVEPNAED